MLGFLKNRRELDFSGAVIHNDSWSLVGVSQSKNAKPELAVCEWLDATHFPDQAKLYARLKQKIREFALDRKGMATTLGLGDYLLVSIEAPDVPPAELRSAVRWQIKDLIDFHLDDAVIDVFDAPMQSHGQSHTIYVVVSKKKQLQHCVQPLHDIDANLTVVDIPELALRNLASYLPENEQGMVLLYFDEHAGVLILIRNSILYLARSLDIGIADLSHESAEARVEAQAQLSLEIQRSLDYYDRYFGAAPIQHVLSAPMQDVCPQLCESLQQQLGLQARFFSVDELVETHVLMGVELQRRSLMSLGVALRVEPSAL